MRWLKFNAVGVMGMMVQIVTLTASVYLIGMHYVLATVLSVEAALLHNFVWHVRWTWPGSGNSRPVLLRRLLHFQLTTGTVSVAGNVGLMTLLVGTARFEPVLANFLCIAACSLVNFVVCDRFVFSRPASGNCPSIRRTIRTSFNIGAIMTPRFRAGARRLCIELCLCASIILGCVSASLAQTPSEGTVLSWNEYVLLTEQRIETELSSSDQGFLVQDFQAPSRARTDREAVLSGSLLVREMNTVRAGGTDVPIRGGMIHHWRGTTLIAGATLEEVLDAVQNPDAEANRQEDVLESRVIERNGDALRIFIKLERRKIVTATYNTEHLVRYRRHSERRASSRTIATKIAELADAGTPREREKPPGEDRGFLWRMNSYWRYQQVEEGVIVECESLTLSRSIPGFVSFIVGPMVSGVAKESMTRTLESMKTRLGRAE